MDVTERFYKRGNLALEYDLKDWLHLNQITSIPYDKKRLYRYYRNQIGRILKKIHSFN
ncbi:Lipopolysaccharide synthesis protein WavE [Vibrio cholerae]|uniref:Lipopolysaccharide synthesis protein WavE n=1 Tax=Vibrio cholerae TaxID=666 RepID=A0A655ZKX2_VIBCL|nr:Lipopolysaccharide synthesis protein WavE [Vibrio cholerae]